jgi:hypothetical protein
MRNDDSKSLNERALTIPGYSVDGRQVRIFAASGFLDPDKPNADVRLQRVDGLGLERLLDPRDKALEGEVHARDLHLGRPLVEEVVALMLRGARGHLHRLSRMRRHTAQRGRPVVHGELHPRAEVVDPRHALAACNSPCSNRRRSLVVKHVPGVRKDPREAAADLDQAGGLHPRLGRRIPALRRIPAPWQVANPYPWNFG